MSEAPVSEEIVVYGDAPDGGGESTTDVLSLPADFYTFYIPAGPTVINPPPPTGGGGSDTPVDPKEEFAEAETKAVWIAGGFALVAVIPGVGEAAMVVAAVAGVAFGIGAHHLGNAADDPPQPDFQRPAGSTLPTRSTKPVGDPQLDAAVTALLDVERHCATFVDAIECVQGAIVAGDAPWVARHADAAHKSYRELGAALSAVAADLPSLAARLRQSAPGQAGPRAIERVIALARPVLGLTASDEKQIRSAVGAAMSQASLDKAEVRAAAATLSRLGQRLQNPTLVDTRFAFVHDRPEV